MTYYITFRQWNVFFFSLSNRKCALGCRLVNSFKHNSEPSPPQPIRVTCWVSRLRASWSIVAESSLVDLRSTVLAKATTLDIGEPICEKRPSSSNCDFINHLKSPQNHSKSPWNHPQFLKSKGQDLKLSFYKTVLSNMKIYLT